MKREEQDVINDIDNLKDAINWKKREYAEFCYDFYAEHGMNNPALPETNIEIETAQILNDNSIAEEEKEQMIYFLTLPKNWQEIHKKFCAELKSMQEKEFALDNELNLIRYNKQMDDYLNSFK